MYGSMIYSNVAYADTAFMENLLRICQAVLDAQTLIAEAEREVSNAPQLVLSADSLITAGPVEVEIATSGIMRGSGYIHPAASDLSSASSLVDSQEPGIDTGEQSVSDKASQPC